jgi:hypothetical protein
VVWVERKKERKKEIRASNHTGLMGGGCRSIFLLLRPSHLLPSDLTEVVAPSIFPLSPASAQIAGGQGRVETARTDSLFVCSTLNHVLQGVVDANERVKQFQAREHSQNILLLYYAYRDPILNTAGSF